MLSASQLREFGERGYLVVPGVVDESFLAAADAEIDALVAADPPPAGVTGKHFYFLPPTQLAAALAALNDSGARVIAEELTAPDPLGLILDHIQVALNIAPYDHRPGGPHIDGHVRQHPDQRAPDSFTLLAGIFLTDETDIDQGSVWVWPGSHLVHRDLFRARGADVLMTTGGHITMLADAPALAAPVPVLGRRGDLLLAHFLLGHNTGGNLTATTRRMLYYRLGCPDHRTRWSDTFLDPFTEFAPVRRAMMEGMVQPVPEHLHTVVPRLVFRREGSKAMQFYVEAFGAEVVEEPHVTPDGQLIHAEIRIGDSSVFLTDEGDEGVAPESVGGQVTAIMALHIPDVDSLWKRATDAGCTVIFPLADQFYGDRGGRLRDPFGHQWMLSTHIEDVSREEMERRMQAMMTGDS